MTYTFTKWPCVSLDLERHFPFTWPDDDNDDGDDDDNESTTLIKGIGSHMTLRESPMHITERIHLEITVLCDLHSLRQGLCDGFVIYDLSCS